MNPNENKVREYFKTDSSFEGGKALFPQLVNPRRSFINALNRMVNTPGNLEKLHYELGMAGGFNERGIKILLNQKLEKQGSVENKQTSTNTTPAGTAHDEFTLPEFEKGLPGMKQKKEFAEANKIEVTGTGKKGRINKVDLDEALLQWQLSGRAQAKAKQIADAIEAIPVPVKQYAKLREQFPFLGQTNCPEVYKILTADLRTAYDKYVEAHGKLEEAVSPEELSKACAAVVDPYKENKLIFAELEHYQKEGTPLGKHAAFAEMNRKAELQTKTAEQLAKLKGNVKTYITKAKQAVKAAKGKEAKKKEKAKQKALEADLVLVTAELKKR